MTKEEARNKLKYIRDGMKKESKLRKFIIIAFAAFAAILCFSTSVYWMARADSANRLDADRPSTVAGHD